MYKFECKFDLDERVWFVAEDTHWIDYGTVEEIRFNCGGPVYELYVRDDAYYDDSGDHVLVHESMIARTHDEAVELAAKLDREEFSKNLEIQRKRVEQIKLDLERETAVLKSMECKDATVTTDKQKYTDFCDDEEKMRDFYNLTRDQFLAFYSYLTPKEYDLTLEKVRKSGGVRVGAKRKWHY